MLGSLGSRNSRSGKMYEGWFSSSWGFELRVLADSSGYGLFGSKT